MGMFGGRDDRAGSAPSGRDEMQCFAHASKSALATFAGFQKINGQCIAVQFYFILLIVLLRTTRYVGLFTGL
jgi:hypothetical protein